MFISIFIYKFKVKTKLYLKNKYNKYCTLFDYIREVY